jgi:hypothetical protein
LDELILDMKLIDWNNKNIWSTYEEQWIYIFFLSYEF